ncbi:hypothetical protein E4L96_04525 [Massilia arenosa]|uniref:DUF4919 domain-containing protein n=1 Tax=Zemynaea arenosa TaxID=2561931 RepID=A0A4Y9SNE7_9BURK|nr:hypothetical protein [Massilia arenosa]TFW26272.1 hypothetical protein E4L96_04525 [Massilia arenosa]
MFLQATLRLGALALALAAGAASAQSTEAITAHLRAPNYTGPAERDALLTFQGTRYNPPLVISGAGGGDPASMQARADVKALRALIEANASGDVNKILDLWTLKERPEIQRRADPESVSKNASYYRKVEKTELFTAAMYGDYRLLVVRHSGQAMSPHFRVYPYIVRNGDYQMTNDLSDDPFYVYLLNAYAKSL